MMHLPYPEDDESAIITATMSALSRWVATVTDRLYPTPITAAADGPGPHIDALLAAIDEWRDAVRDNLTPTLIAVFTRRMIDLAVQAGVDINDLATTLVPDESTSLLMEQATAAAATHGIPQDGFGIIIGVATWADHIATIARTTPNLVAGMPEAVYRDLVTKLSSAARDGATPWERSVLARDYLSMDTEGGYDQWMIRARRIARTETGRVINAADMATMRLTVDGDQDLDKVWVAGMDARTRDTHFAADGQRVPLNGKFMIGGHEADYPGDPSLPAHESINCRCTCVYLESGEPLPAEVDRQTERAHADGTTRNPAAEIRDRAQRGVTRARDDEHETVTAAGEPSMTRRAFSGVLAPIGVLSGDGRIIDSDATIDYREFPLPLLFQKATSTGHDTAIVVGKIIAATTSGEAITATGEFFDTPEAEEATRLVAEGVIRPSVDLCDTVVDWVWHSEDGTPIDPDSDDWDPEMAERVHVRSATVMAATLVSTPAFAEAKIILGEETVDPVDEDEQQALVAASCLLDNPTVDASAFNDPHLDAPTALNVTDDGRVLGHLALWGTEHVGMPGRRVTPPHSSCGYALFHVSTINTTTGPLSCGRLTVGCGHADARATMRDAAAHYDQTGTTWAFVRAGEDRHGIWVAGVINPDADDASIRAGASAPLSGDWRSVGGNLELVAALSVNTPGFPVPRSYASREEALSLTAAAVVPRHHRADALADAVAEGIRRYEHRKDMDQAGRKARRLHASILRSTIMMRGH